MENCECKQRCSMLLEQHGLLDNLSKTASPRPSYPLLQRKKAVKCNGSSSRAEWSPPHWLDKVLGCLNRAFLGSEGRTLLVSVVLCVFWTDFFFWGAWNDPWGYPYPPQSIPFWNQKSNICHYLLNQCNYLHAYYIK